MKRTIKFRAWDDDAQVMIYSDHYKNADYWWEISPLRIGCITGDTGGNSFEPPEPIVSYYEKVMQFTGLFDKNGKEIYEGDILKFQYYINYGFAGIHPKEIIAVITFENGGFWFSGDGYTDCNWHFYDAKDREVIGNLYENYELINPK